MYKGVGNESTGPTATAKRGRPRGTGRQTTGSPDSAVTGQHTAGTKQLLDTLRAGKFSESLSNPSTTGGSARQSITGTDAEAGTGYSGNAGNYETSTNYDRATGQAAGRFIGQNGTVRNDHVSPAEGSIKLIGNSSSPARPQQPKGLKAAPPPKAVPRPKEAADAKTHSLQMPWLEGVQVIRPDEAEALTRNLTEGLKAVWRGLDEGIGFTNKAKHEAYIWQAIDDEDTRYLAGGMVNIGMKVPAAAWAVRGMANASHQLRVGLILGPKFIETWQFYSTFGGFKL